MRALLALIVSLLLVAGRPAPADASAFHLKHHVGPAGTAPLCQNVTVPVGDHTPLNMGTVLLKNIGITALGSAPIVSWRTSNVVATGGGANTDLGGLLASNTAAATARSPKPTLGAVNSLSTVTLAATSYAISVTEVTSGGAEATCTLTYAIQPNAFNLGDNNVNFGDPDELNNGTVSSRIGTKGGGLTMLLSVGADFSTQDPFRMDDLAPATGRMGIQYADAARPSRIPALDVNNTIHVDITGLGIGGSINHKIWLRGTTSGTTVKNSYPLGASIADVRVGNAAGNQDFILLSGVSGNTVDNNYLLYGGRGIVVGSGTNGNFITNNTIRYVYGDLSAIGASTNDTITGNLMLSPMRDTDTSGSPDHVDNTQWDGGTITGLVFADNIMAEADGTAAASGYQGGAFNITAVWKNNISLFRASTAANLSAWLNGSIIDSTWLEVGSGKIGMEGLNADDNVFNGHPGFHDTGSTGANTLTRVFVPYSSTMNGTWTVTNSPNQTLSIPNAVQFTYDGVTFNREPDMGGSTYATSGVFKYSNTLERLNNYNASTNPAGADYPNMTPAQIKALILDVLTPATGGTLDLGGANTNTIGAVNRDGTLKQFFLPLFGLVYRRRRPANDNSQPSRRLAA